jgi:hypothetical protein
MAQDKAQNTTDIDTLVSVKPALVTDINSTHVAKDQYSYARNATRNSKDGDLGTLGNEPSLIQCIQAPYPVVGTIDMPDGNLLVLSGDGVNSEIGIGDPRACSYKTLKSMPCLNFSAAHPITGVAKNFQNSTVVTFTDKYNPIRRIDLKKLDKYNDCDDMLLFRKVKQPCIQVKRGQTGNLPNGTYSVAIGYAVDGQLFTDLFSLTTRVQVWSQAGANSLEIKLHNMDTEFDQFALVVIGNYIDPVTKGATKLAKQIGIYSTKQKSISITDFINSSYIDIPISQLVLKKTAWTRAGISSKL